MGTFAGAAAAPSQHLPAERERGGRRRRGREPRPGRSRATWRVVEARGGAQLQREAWAAAVAVAAVRPAAFGAGEARELRPLRPLQCGERRARYPGLRKAWPGRDLLVRAERLGEAGSRRCTSERASAEEEVGGKPRAPRMRGTRSLAVLLALASLLPVVMSLRIAAFNIRSFGETKMSNGTLSSYIVQILSRYDIVLVQEVRDTYLTAVGKLLDELNRNAPDNYHYVVSNPLGRSSYKEQYLFLYRPDQASVLDSYYYDDGCEPCGNDTFSREPAIVKFFSPFTHVREFAIVPLHAAPADAVAEIDALYDVYLDVRQKWGLEDVMLMGDFNAGCSYVTASQWSSIRLRTDPAFQWLIPDTADTTVTSTHCAYDRIVVSGALLQAAIVPDSAGPYDFQEAFGLSDQLAEAISDHYPVEVTLRIA